MKKFILCAMAALLLFSCSKNEENYYENPEELILRCGDIIQFDSFGKVEYSSSNPFCVKVLGGGIIQAARVGTARLTSRSETQTSVQTVRVIAAQDQSSH